MAGRPSKTLRDRVRDNSFEARRQQHRELLAAHDVPWPDLAELQRRYREADSDFERYAIAREFEKTVVATHAEATEDGGGEADTLEEELDKLGPVHSAKRLKAFFPRFLTLETGERFVLQEWTEEFIDEGWRRREEDGRRLYKEMLLGIPRGNGKTPVEAGIGTLTTLEAPPVPAVYQAAGSKEQAKVGIDFATMWAGDESELAQWFRAKARALELRGRRGHFSIVSADGRLFHGRKPSAVLVDEWWLYQTYREEQVYVAGQTALEKFPEAFLLATSTAGFDKNSQLGQAFDKALALPSEQIEHRRDGFLTIARDLEGGFLMWWYGMPDGYDLDLEDDDAVLHALRLANPSTFVDCEGLLRALRRPTTDPYEWMRLHLNAWTQTRDAWLPLGCFAGLRTDQMIPVGSEIYVAVDAAIKYDTTAVVWAARVNGKIRLQGRSWAARDGAPAHERHQGGRIRNSEVMEWIDRELGGRYRVREIVSDPKFFEDYVWELGRRGYTAAEFAQNSGEMRAATQHFYEAATSGAIEWHDPAGIFPLHVAATSARPTKGGWIVENPEKSKPIDLATAAIMARERCAVNSRIAKPFAQSW